MPPDLEFNFYLADRSHPVRRDDPLAATPIPLNRSGKGPSTRRSGSPPVTYGDYFCAIRDFLGKDSAGTLCRACADILKTAVTAAAIGPLHVFLAKHGEFYHPCRVATDVGGQQVELVLNGAVSEKGRRLISNEFGRLKRLTADFPYEFVPRVYACGSGVDQTHRPIRMFLAQWFGDYHECHLSRDPLGGPDRVKVWDAGDEASFLTRSQTADFYRSCARILTSYYNPMTYEQIFPWHHAAGDFIVARRASGIDVKLITVRDYAPLFAEPREDGSGTQTAADEAQLLDGLLVFFLAMSLRMRLDRLDGVGPVAWAPEAAVAGAVSGYFQGLAAVCEQHEFPEDLARYVKGYLLAHPQEALADLCEEIGSGYPSGSEEAVAIRRNSASHARAILRRIASNQP